MKQINQNQFKQMEYPMNFPLKKSVAATSLALLALAAQAQSAATSAITPSLSLSPITVTATRSEHRVDEVPASVSVISAEQISRQNVDTVQELLKDIESIDISQQSGVAHAIGVNMRGSGGSFVGNTTQLMMDGVVTDSIISSVIGRGGLNYLSPWDVETVEVVRGPGSAVYGSGVIGGMVNVIPKRWKGEAGVELHGAYGSHNTQKLGAAVGVAKENYDLRLSVYDAKTDGYVAQPILAFGNIDLGPRDWKDKKLSFIGGFRPSNNQEITLAAQTFGTRSAVVGGRPFDRQNLDGQSYTLGYRHDFGEFASVKASYRVTHNEQTWLYDQLVGGVYLPSLNGGGRISDSTDLNVQADLHLSPNNLLIAGVSHGTAKHETRSTTLAGVSTFGQTEATADGLYLQDEHKLGAWTLLAGGRFDRISQFGDATNGVPKAGVLASTDNVFNPRIGTRFKLSDATSLYASYGTAYLPAYNSLKYVQPTTTRVDNPNLKPERSTSFELGANFNTGSGQYRVAVYQTEYKDKIALVANVVGALSQWQNYGKAVATGFEFGWEGKFGSAWSPYVNYSYTDSRIKADTNRLNIDQKITYTSPNKLNLGLTYAASDSWSATINGRYVDQKWLTTPNTDTVTSRLGGYFTADAKLSFKLPVAGRKWDAYIAVNNLNDKIYSQWAYYEKSDGRTFTVGIDGRF